MKIYLDNAATTPVDEVVWQAIEPYVRGLQGNPSSIHAYGRAMRNTIEKARRKVADILGTSPSEIFFTSGATESDNMALWGLVRAHRLKRIITSNIEHHAVLHTAQHIALTENIVIDYVNLHPDGGIDTDHLTYLLQQNLPTVVSLMHANNEIGNITDLEKVGTLCREYKAFFHSDTVQTVGYYPFELAKMPIDSIVGSAHKFHGLKGSGFIYLKAGSQVSAFIHGGAQERNMRGGTENIAGIVGLATALEQSHSSRQTNIAHILHLKQTAIQLIKETFGEKITFNGKSASLLPTQALPTVLSLRLPPSEANEMLLFNLDIAGIAVSGGSACASGSSVGSHVMEALRVPAEAGVVRLSFGKQNTIDEIKETIYQLRRITNQYHHV